MKVRYASYLSNVTWDIEAEKSQAVGSSTGLDKVYRMASDPN